MNAPQKKEQYEIAATSAAKIAKASVTRLDFKANRPDKVGYWEMSAADALRINFVDREY